MKQLVLRLLRQSPAMIVAMLALFVALTGTAVATTAAVITGAQIKNNSITGADVKNKSLTPRDFRGSVRGPRGLRGLTGATGATGATGPKGDKGDKGDIGPSNALANDYGAYQDLAAFPTETTMRTVTLGAGSYWIHAKAFIDHDSGGTLNARCFLNLPVGATGVDDGLFIPVAVDSRAVLVIDGAVTLSASGNVTLTCNKGSAGEDGSAAGRISVIKVGSLTVGTAISATSASAATGQ